MADDPTGIDPHALELEPMSERGIDAALERAHRYRMLNEPGEAESICRDVLAIQPGNQAAIQCLLLALTDQFPRGVAERIDECWRLDAELDDEYRREYYAGIICERRAKAQYRQATPGGGEIAYHWMHEAMQRFEKADAVSPDDVDNAILRRNACVRFLRKHPDVRPRHRPEPDIPAMLE